MAFCSPDSRPLCARALRKMQARFERLRVDIVDFEPRGAPLLQGGSAAGESLGSAEGLGSGAPTRPWVALGKHLCGAATDLTLRCCARHCARADPEQGLQPASCLSSGLHVVRTGVHCAAGAAAAHGGLAAASSRSPAGKSPGGDPDGRPVDNPGRGLMGLAVATCCHHRCTWRDFVGKRLVLSLGFSPAEFEIISYMCAWASGGHSAAPGGAAAPSSDSETSERSSGVRSQRASAVSRPDATPSGAAAVSRGFDPEAGSDRVETGCGLPATAGSEQRAADEEAAARGSSGNEGSATGFQAYFLPIERRIALGAAAKQLIDAARVDYLREQGLVDARAVQYVSQQVSAENRLLVASTGRIGITRIKL